MSEQDSLREEFLNEATEHLANVETDLLDIEKQGKNFEQDIVDRLFRAMHSIKGTSSFLELHNVTDLSHAMENVVDQMRSKRLLPSEAIVQALLSGLDKLEQMITDLDNLQNYSIHNERDALQQLIASPVFEEENEDVKEEENEKPATNKDKNILSLQAQAQTTITKKTDFADICNQKYKYRIRLDLAKECSRKKRAVTDFFSMIKIIGEMKEGHFIESTIPKNKEQFAANEPGLEYEFLLITDLDDTSVLMESLDIDPISIDTIETVDKIDKIEIAPTPPEPQQKSLTSQPSSIKQENKEEIKQEKNTDQKNEKVSGQEVQKQNKVSQNQDIVQTHSRPRSQYLRISVSLLDELMDLASELVLVRNQNMQLVDTGDQNQLKTVAKKLNVVTSELQTCVMHTRMQPIDSIFSKYTRLIRDLSKKVNKLVDLQITGQDVELDKNIIESINDPIMHLLRNAVDHGIELPHERKNNNKKETGKVELKAYHQAGLVYIEIKDDGKGLDTEKLSKAAIAKGIATKSQISQMNDQEIFHLIFHPGFSTAQEVTDISGRGVGMDVVQTNIKKLGGTIDIHSTPNKGTKFSIKLPLTLTIISALIIETHGLRFAIPQFSIAEVVWLYNTDLTEKIREVNSVEVFRLREKWLPLIRLGNVLQLKETDAQTNLPGNKYLEHFSSQITSPQNGQKTNENEDATTDYSQNFKKLKELHEKSKYIIVLKLGELRYGLLVDKVIDTEEIVIKSLHKQMKKSQVFAGTTVLGDGNIAMILDITNLARKEQFDISRAEMPQQLIEKRKEDKQTVIQFQIGNKERFVIPLFLIKHIEKIKLSQIQMTGNKEFLDYQNNILPIIRIDKALDFISADYSDEVYVFIVKSKKPIGILVSEIIDVAEIFSALEADHMRRPGIIGMVNINGQITLVADIFQIIEILEPQWFAKEKAMGQTRDRLLLLEDTPFYATFIKSYLQGLGLDVQVAQNGQEGLKELQKENFDFIISDLEMPVMDGFEFARHVRSQDKYKHIPLLAISAIGEKKGKKMALEAGFDNFVSKLNQETMLDALKNVSKKTG